MANEYASLESQIGNDVCTVGDTEEIFWLKMSDDCQSKIKAGDLLVRQYRFRDAIEEYKKALRIKSDDAMLHIKIAGSYLTLFEYAQAVRHYTIALECGAKEETVAFYMGVKDFLQGKYKEAVENFEKADVHNGEMLISVIYWHAVSSLRLKKESGFLTMYNDGIDVGHHSAYKWAVRLFSGLEQVDNYAESASDLDNVIMLYGIAEYLRFQNKTEEAQGYITRLLTYSNVWPCIAYLAAYNN